MAFTLLLSAILLFGLTLVLIGAIVLALQKNRRAGCIVLGVGLFTTVLSVLGFLSLVITSSTMG